MTDENHRNTAGFGKAEQGRRTLSYLCDTARRCFHIFGGDGLDGVYDDQFGLNFLDMLEDGFQGSFAENEQIFACIG